MNPRVLMGVAVIAAATFLHGVAQGAVIGRNTPARSLTRERIAGLPKSDRPAWLEYLERSEGQRAADKSALAAELKAVGHALPTTPEHSHGAHPIPLHREAHWYATEEARQIANNLVSYQTPAGGWGKNTEMTRAPRRAGERYAANNVSQFLSSEDFDTPADPDWNYIGTIDNDATTTQLNFLARVIGAARDGETGRLRAAYAKGIAYLLNAQYPNGGWPQVWPLEGGYHDAITFNDNAMTEVMELLRKTATGEGDFSFVPEEVRQRASAAFERGLQCVLHSQIEVDGRLTGWPQQEDPLTLEPVSARNYEMPAVSSGESADLMVMLMEMRPAPTEAEQKSIRAVASWFEKTALDKGLSAQRAKEGGFRHEFGQGPLWARFYQIGTDRPIFGDRDKSIHDDVHELSQERRSGYGWYGSAPSRALEIYAAWKKNHMEKK